MAEKQGPPETRHDLVPFHLPVDAPMPDLLHRRAKAAVRRPSDRLEETPPDDFTVEAGLRNHRLPAVHTDQFPGLGLRASAAAHQDWPPCGVNCQRQSDAQQEDADYN